MTDRVMHGHHHDRLSFKERRIINPHYTNVPFRRHALHLRDYSKKEMSMRRLSDHEIESVITRIRTKYMVNSVKMLVYYLLKSINLIFFIQ